MDDLLHCIENTANSRISALIIAAPDTQRVKSRLARLGESVAVILLEEYMGIDDAENVRFVEEDSFESGRRPARLYFKGYPQSRAFAIVENTPYSLKKRIDGLKAAMDEAGLPPPVLISGELTERAGAAIFAR